jgi:molybdopterin-containing oxidoreductase family membrane subunit
MALQFDRFVQPNAVDRLRHAFRIRASEGGLTVLAKSILLLAVPVALGGVAAGGVAFVGGHHTLGTTSEMPWGSLIAAYVFLVSAASGLCMVSSLGHVFGYDLFKPIAKPATFLALILLLIGFAVIASELEFPLRLALLAVISPNPTAPIWWMGMLYAVYTLSLAFELWFLFTDNHSRARLFGIVSLCAAFFAQANLGAVFGMTRARPFWSGPFYPLYFVALALLCGAALIAVMVFLGDFFGNGRAIRERNAELLSALGNLLGVFVAVVLFFTFWRMLTTLQSGQYHAMDVALAVVAGPLFLSFWLFEIFLGMAVPLTLLLSGRRRTPRCIFLASLLAITGVFVMRYNFVFAGQMLSLKPVTGHLGESLHYAPPFKGDVAGFLAYTPSLTEALIVFGALAGVVLLFVAGMRVLKLEQEA